MKKSFLIAALVTLPLSLSQAWAEETHHTDKDKKPAAAMTDKDKQMQMSKMQENMLKMHEQMHKIMDAKNPQERDQLMQAHAKMMQDGMQMMKTMMGGHEMMGSDAKGSMMDGGGMGMGMGSGGCGGGGNTGGGAGGGMNSK